jgi:hypothetical protein
VDAQVFCGRSMQRNASARYLNPESLPRNHFSFRKELVGAHKQYTNEFGVDSHPLVLIFQQPSRRLAVLSLGSVMHMCRERLAAFQCALLLLSGRGVF